VGAVSLSHVAIEQLDCVVDGAAGRAMMAYGSVNNRVNGKP
jgi:hypothetical protein